MAKKIKIKIRKASKDDAMSIAEIGGKSGYRWAECIKDELKLAKKIISSNSLLYIAEHKNEAVGYFALTIRNKIADISFLSVKKQHHNKGIGAKLLDCMIRLSKKNNKMSKMRIDVWAKNFPAIGLYNKFGFYVIKVMKRHYPNGDDKLVMEKMLR